MYTHLQDKENNTVAQQSSAKKTQTLQAKRKDKKKTPVQRKENMGDERSMFDQETHTDLDEKTAQNENRSMFEGEEELDGGGDPKEKLKKNMLKMLSKNFKGFKKQIKRDYKKGSAERETELEKIQDAYAAEVYYIEDIFNKDESYEATIKRLKNAGYAVRDSKASIGQVTYGNNQKLPSDYKRSTVTNSRVKTRVKHKKFSLRKNTEKVRLDSVAKDKTSQVVGSSQNATIKGTGTEVIVIIKVAKASDPIRTSVRVGEYDKDSDNFGNKDLLFENGNPYVIAAPGTTTIHKIPENLLKGVRKLSAYSQSQSNKSGNVYTIDLIIKSNVIASRDQIVLDVQQEKRK